MKKVAFRIVPCSGYDIPGLEHWLEKMALQGLCFSIAIGPMAWFERTQPQQLQIHLEPVQGSTVDDPALNDIYAQAGWQYWGMFHNNYYIFATTDLTAEAHTDPKTQGYALKKFFHWKLAGGALLILAHLLLLGLYYDGAPWEIGLTWLRYFPMETLSHRSFVPFILSLAGLSFVDLSYLLGMVRLIRYRKSIQTGISLKQGIRAGYLQAAGLILLLPVLINTVQLYAGLDYSPYDLDGSGFVTLTEIEGDDFPVSQKWPDHMDYISHGGTLLDPESWYFEQKGAHGLAFQEPEVARLQIRAIRYPLEFLAKLYAEELSRQSFNRTEDHYDLMPVQNLDQALYAPRRKDIVSLPSGETREFLPGGILILRRGHTVLFADYYGEQDLRDFLPAFLRTLDNL